MIGFPKIDGLLGDLGFGCLLYLGGIFSVLKIVQLNGDLFIEKPIVYH